MFELRALRTLETNFHGLKLRRVGGKDDGGIDLVGWWDLPTFSRRLRVLAQCKAEKKKSSPKYVREMEGVSMVYNAGVRSPLNDTSVDEEEESSPKGSVVALLLSESPFTKSTILRALKSPIPLMLLHVPPVLAVDGNEPVVASVSEPTFERADLVLGGVVWNPAMQAIFPGCELRTELGGGGTTEGFGIWHGPTRL
ncbi:hypothetical protein CYLTODRAFT_350240 [Cylindrobasidium torrendii FP15055 ss-10]|uniref:Restriction endonuclease type IV Mrr domain-containing protein n=1 Tax=Cylindrobasidium torrendii FP15055 ss-10 TaxID=1314674 RepID=A0A0D7BFZ5_9AGAR|nr:hypothetical protein CYLTODRAFT_350240 [Cylindrobasidium torrendii FP15055 ss-10]